MTKHLYLVLPVLACALLVAVYRVYSSSRSIGPATLLERAEEELQRNRPDYAVVLRYVDKGLELAREADDAEQGKKILQRRAEVLRQMGLTEQSRKDYERLLAEYDPLDHGVGITLAHMEFQAGERERALERIDALVERDVPAWPIARRTRAEFLLAMADSVMEECQALCNEVLDDEQAERAARLTQWVAARDEGDLGRAAMLEEVDSRFPTSREVQRARYNQLLHTASVFYDECYADYAQTIDAYTDQYMLGGMTELLDRTGRPRDVVDFGLASLRWLVSGDRGDAIQVLASALHDLGRDRDAALVVDVWGARKVTDDFLPEWIEIAWGAERWSDVATAASLLHQRVGGAAPRAAPPPEPDPKKPQLVVREPVKTEADRQRSATLFYMGVAQSRMGNHTQALSALGSYAYDVSRTEPFPGAFAEAEAARAWSLLSQGGANRRHEGALALMSSLVLRDEAAADEWLEAWGMLSQSEPTPEEREDLLAHLMAALPDRSLEFEPMWRAVAQERLDESRLDLQMLRRQASRDSLFVPSQRVGPYALFLLAELYRREGAWAGVYAASSEVLELVPFFPPALELFLQAAGRMGRTSQGIDLLLDRAEFLGHHEGTLAALDELRPAMSSAQVARYIELDPRRTGLHETARWLIDQRRPEEARVALESARELHPAGAALLGEALLALDRPQAAIAALRAVPVDDPVYPAAFRHLLDAAIRLADRQALDEVLATAAAPGSPVGDALVGAVDELVLGREPAAALGVVEFLDRDRGTRSGRNLMRKAALELRLGARDEALETLERAYAFQADGGPSVGRVIAAILGGRPEELAPALADLEADAGGLRALRPEVGSIVGLLAGREDVARAVVAQSDPTRETRGTRLLLYAIASRRLSPETAAVPLADPALREATSRFLWEGGADGQQALALLLALESPDWRPWLLLELDARGDVATQPWSALLQAEALYRMGQYERADLALRALTERWPAFTFGFSLAKELLRVQPPSEEDLLRVAKSGWAAAPSPQVQEARRRLQLARQAFEAGDASGAMELVQQGLSLAPQDAPLAWLGTLVLRSQERYAEAAEYAVRFLGAIDKDKRTRDAALPELLSLFDVAVAGRLMPAAVWQQFLERVAARCPDNPLVVVRRAEREARIARSNPVAGVRRAFQTLDAFRADHPDATLESLGTGSLRAWHEFYCATSPVRGEAMLRRELLLDPRSPDVRCMLAESLLAQGRREEARDALDTLLAILPHDGALYLWARLEAEAGASPEQIERAASTLASLRAVRAEDPALRFLVATSKVSTQRGADTAEGLAELTDLWDRRDELVLDQRLAVDVGRTLGMSLMRVGDEQQSAQAQEIFETLTRLDLPRDEVRLYALMSHIGPNPTDVEILPKGDRKGELQAQREARAREELKRRALELAEVQSRIKAQNKALVSPEKKGKKKEPRGGGRDISNAPPELREAWEKLAPADKERIRKLPPAEASAALKKAAAIQHARAAAGGDGATEGEPPVPDAPDAPEAPQGDAPADGDAAPDGEAPAETPRKKKKALSPEEKRKLREQREAEAAGGG